MKRTQRIMLFARFSWLLLATGAAAAWAQDDEQQFTVIKAGRVITVAGEDITPGEVVLVDGVVRLVGRDLEYPQSARVIDARGETVMPGMIDARSRWQLPGYTRSGVHGDRSVAKEVYLDRLDMQPLLEAGFTTICLYPYGSGVPGPAVAFHTAGPAADRELGDAYLRITMTNPGGDKKVLREAVDRAKKEIEKVDKARKEWEEKQKKAKAEAEKEAAEKKEGDKPADEKKPPSAAADADQNEKEQSDETKKEDHKPEEFTPPKIDPAVLPFVHWLRDDEDQRLPILFELSNAADLLHLDDVLQTIKELPGTRVYLSGTTSTDYHYVVDKLGDREALALLQPWISKLPSTVNRYNLSATLNRAGCRIVLVPTGDTRTHVDKFRSRVAELVRAGLPRDAAIAAITLHAAEAIGMEESLGSIEKGKQADLLFLDGDPLDPLSHVTRVMIQGEIAWEKP